MNHLEILTYLNTTFNANFYLVGGYVRDLLVGINSNDYDIATDLEPESLLEIATKKNLKVFPTGLKHGTITLLLDGKTLEITTFRKDFENNGRHCSVQFTKSIKEDALRRDFTINAIYLDSKGIFYDFHSGKIDLEKSRVKFIGTPEQRINEDYLRILRFFRFFADFDKGAISLQANDLKQALENNAHKITQLSADRISQEVLKLAACKNYFKGFSAFADFYELANIFKLQKSSLKLKDYEITQSYEPFFKLCLVYRNNLQDLLDLEVFNWSNKQKSFVKFLINAKNLNITEETIIKNSVVYTKPVAEFWIIAKYLNGDIIKIELTDLLSIIKNDLPEFKITGNDLISLGFKADKNLGSILNCIKSFWLDNNFADKQKCLDFARKVLKNNL
jgi:poly(A) polymerase